MKIECRCGALIIDQTDNLPHKAHLVPDQEWDDLLAAIDRAIERSGPGAGAREAAVMAVRGRLAKVARQAWQCRACGRLYVDDGAHEAREFVPAAGDVPREIFRTRR